MANQSGEKVSDTNNKIRDFVNDSIVKRTNIFAKKNSGDWNQFCAALDTIGDTSLAIESFEKSTESSFSENPYLFTYGLLQALVIQQDAVNFLKISLFGTDKKIVWWDKKYAELGTIRNLRNETIGHPVKTELKRNGAKYENDEITSCTIDRSSLSKEGFDYMLWKHSGTDRKRIEFSEILELQNNNLNDELKAIMKELKREEKEHKLKFKGDKLLPLLDAHSLYQVNNIYGVQWDDHLAWPSFDHYYKKYKQIRAGIESRYGKFGTLMRLSGTEELVKKIDYVFAKIEGFKTVEFDNYELEVYVDALDAALIEFRDHLKEIDAEFEI